MATGPGAGDRGPGPGSRARGPGLGPGVVMCFVQAADIYYGDGVSMQKVPFCKCPALMQGQLGAHSGVGDAFRFAPSAQREPRQVPRLVVPPDAVAVIVGEARDLRRELGLDAVLEPGSRARVPGPGPRPGESFLIGCEDGKYRPALVQGQGWWGLVKASSQAASRASSRAFHSL